MLKARRARCQAPRGLGPLGKATGGLGVPGAPPCTKEASSLCPLPVGSCLALRGDRPDPPPPAKIKVGASLGISGGTTMPSGQGEV